jgi:hypothetical protein
VSAGHGAEGAKKAADDVTEAVEEAVEEGDDAPTIVKAAASAAAAAADAFTVIEVAPDTIKPILGGDGVTPNSALDDDVYDVGAVGDGALHDVYDVGAVGDGALPGDVGTNDADEAFQSDYEEYAAAAVAAEVNIDAAVADDADESADDAD